LYLFFGHAAKIELMFENRCELQQIPAAPLSAQSASGANRFNRV
jgi:hypothetical protein